MSDAVWRQLPVGLDAPRWVTRLVSRSVIAVVHNITYGQRVLDTISLLEGDWRLQVVFSRPPQRFGDGTDDFLRAHGAAVLPWGQAVNQEFDLAIAAGHGGLEELQAPVVVFPHGASNNKLTSQRERGGTVVARAVANLGPQQLIRDGMVVPTRIVLPHDDDLGRLARQCPEALPCAVVVGDLSHDRIVASLSRRAAYRAALGIGEGQRLVVVTSTWSRTSLFGDALDVVGRLLVELPPSWRVIMLTHPNSWAAHGGYQMRSWLKDYRRRGLGLVPPEAEWRSALIAADWIIGDHGSATLYGTLVDAPILLAAAPTANVNPDSPIATLMTAAPTVSASSPVVDQLRYAADEYTSGYYAGIASRLTSEPGRFARNARRLLYNELRLSQPASIPVAEPLVPPAVVWPDTTGASA